MPRSNSKAHYERNKEAILLKSKETYFLNKDKLLLYQVTYRKENKELIQAKATNKRRDRQQQAIERLGNKCNICGHQYPNCVYDFHHINPEEKEFTIGENSLIGKKRYFAEVDKCMLLCANCHRILHRKEKDAT